MGIKVAASELRWAILEGTDKSGHIEAIDPPKLVLPVSGTDEAENLMNLRDQVRTLLIAKKPDSVAVIRAGKGVSVIRVKIECMIQLAAKEAKIKCRLISPLTIVAAEKRKIAKATGTTFEAAYGTPKPAYTKEALLCAWSVLNGS